MLRDSEGRWGVAVTLWPENFKGSVMGQDHNFKNYDDKLIDIKVLNTFNDVLKTL